MSDLAENVRIPKDPVARARLAEMAGLTEAERLAIDKWCDHMATEDAAKRRRGMESADLPIPSESKEAPRCRVT